MKIVSAVIALIAVESTLAGAISPPPAIPDLHGTYEQQLAALPRDLPIEVRDFIERRAGCNHWLGEDPFDAERKAEILAALEELRCQTTDLTRDEAALRQRYAPNNAVLNALEVSKDWSP